jgi:hypothetical protein
MIPDRELTILGSRSGGDRPTSSRAVEFADRRTAFVASPIRRVAWFGDSMVFAEIHGKLGPDYARAHERAEDLLTSTVFGLLRYVPLADGLLAAIQQVRPVRIDDQDRVEVLPDSKWVDVSGVVDARLDFWPYWRGFGEPDVLLTLSDGLGRPCAVVLVEAKLHAPKGGRSRHAQEPADDVLLYDEQDPDDAGDDLADDAAPDPDQLVRYWTGLHQRVPTGVQARMIYLTKHAAPPADDLGESVRKARNAGGPPMELAWLSWRDIWVVAQRAAGRERPDADSARPAADLARLLAHKGLKPFTGFHGEPWRTPRSIGFWTGPGWFARHSGGRIWAVGPGFWNRGPA